MKIVYFLSFLLVFASCKKSATKKHLSKITGKRITVDTSFTASKEIDKMVAPYKEKLAAKMEEVLSFATNDLLKSDGKLQSSLGNLIADLSFEMANPIFRKKTTENIDFVLLNNGGIRAIIPKGKITTEHAFKLMPFENELVVVKLSGEKINDLVTYFINDKKAHPLSKNVALTITNDGYALKINGKPFDKNKSYRVLTTDFLQTGGDKMNFFKNPEKLTKLNYKMRDAIIDFFRKTDNIKATTDNRVIIK